MLRSRSIRPAPFLGSLALTLLLTGAPMAGADGPGARVAEVRAEAGTTRVAVNVAPGAQPQTFFLSGPDRFVVDIPRTHWEALAGQGQVSGQGVAHRYRFANRPDGAARLVLDLSGPARLVSARTEQGGRRLVFELAGVEGVETPERAPPAFLRQPVQLIGAAAGASEAPAPRAGARLIVVDAGHGGRDPGALSPSGYKEKDINLAAALKLKDALEARGYEVALTRDGDSFIELSDRVRIARERGAALFISLHADSAPGSSAKGAAVYMLSQSGEQRSRRLMDAQDWHVDVGQASGGVENILLDLTQRETTSRSAEFARLVLAEMEEAGAPILHRTPRNAGFFVLLAPDVPAVLVEMGFLTQAQDEARLADPDAQARLTEALADAVDAHFASPRTMARLMAGS